MERYKKAKYVCIVALSVILDMCLHVVTSNYTVIPKGFEWSAFSKIFSVPLVSTLWALLAFSSVAYIFIRFQNKISGIKWAKGLYYGIPIGFLWLIATLAGVSTFGNPLINEFVTGICDAIPVTVMCCLLGVFSNGENSVKNVNKSINMRNAFFSIMIFTGVFLIGRYLSYFSNIIKSGYQTNPYYTFFWTVLMGIFIGVVYLSLGQATQSSSVIQSSIKFGLIIFGVNWAVFGIFMPLIFKGFIKDFISTVVLDTMLVTISYYLSETFVHKMEIKNRMIENKQYKF